MLTIIQNFFDANMREKIGPLHAEYASKRGYVYLDAESQPPIDRVRSWSKITLLSVWCASAAHGDEVVYLDEHAVIVRNEPLDGLTAGRDIALIPYAVDQHRWFGTDVIIVRKRSDRPREFFDRILSGGPMGVETLPVSSIGECGRFNSLIHSAGLNINMLGNEYFESFLTPHRDPIIRSCHGDLEFMRRLPMGVS